MSPFPPPPMPVPVEARHPVCVAAKAIGAVLMIVGVLGVIGFRSDAVLFGVIGGSGPLDLVHVGLGGALVAAARTVVGARALLVGSGVFYGLLSIGFPLNAQPIAWHGLHVDGDWIRWATAATMIVVGIAVGRNRREDGART